MDAEHFDALAKALGGQASRRAMAGGFAGGVLGSLLRLFWSPEEVVEAAKRKKRHKRKQEHKAKDKHDKQAQQEKKKKKRKKKNKQNRAPAAPPPPSPPTAPPPVPPPVECEPNPNACGDRICSSVDNGCGVQVACGPNGGACPGANDTCAPNGQCNCTANPDPCAGRECGEVDDDCGVMVACGPLDGGCPGANDVCSGGGECVCNPTANPCADRVCGQVDNGCGDLVTCGPNDGVCTRTNDTCEDGQCVCHANPSACGDRVCGAVDDDCGVLVSCGPNQGACLGTDTCTANGQCVCTPNPGACGNRECGEVDNGCGDLVACGADNGDCTGSDFCNANGRCRPAICQSCEGCCGDGGTCEAGASPQTCGHSGRDCETCNPEVACVNGECTCSRISCAQGCCMTDQQGRPFCDNLLRPCGNTCIPKEACCTGQDSLFYQETTPGCHPNETCVVNSSGFGECRCGSGGRCWFNQGCCTLDGNDQPTCDTNLRPCGEICIAKEECCRQGQLGCDDGVSCTSETCQPLNGLGICVETFPDRICAQACEAGQGYGNDSPRNEREVRCGASGSVSGLPCYCWRTTEGDNVCTEDVFSAPACRRSEECGDDEVCIRAGLTTGANVCAPICR